MVAKMGKILEEPFRTQIEISILTKGFNAPAGKCAALLNLHSNMF